MAAPSYKPIDWGFSTQTDLARINNMPRDSFTTGFTGGVQFQENIEKKKQLDLQREAQQVIGDYLQTEEATVKSSADKMNDVAGILTRYGQVDDAMKLGQQAESLKRQEENERQQMLNVAIAAARAGDPQFAEALFQQHKLGETFPTPNWREQGARVDAMQGDGLRKIYPDGSTRIMVPPQQQDPRIPKTYIDLTTGEEVIESDPRVRQNPANYAERDKAMDIMMGRQMVSGMVGNAQNMPQANPTPMPGPTPKPFMDASKSAPKKKVQYVIPEGIEVP